MQIQHGPAAQVRLALRRRVFGREVGRAPTAKTLCCAELAVECARFAAGVSRRHGAESIDVEAHEVTAQRNALSRLVAQLFNGSPQALIAQLVDEHQVSPDELQQLGAVWPATRRR